MQSIPYQLEQRLQAKVAECIHLASERFDTYFPQPTIRLVSCKQGVGSAHPLEWLIELDEAITYQDPESVIHNTLPHEVAHLVDFKMNFATYTKMKRVPWHGYGWKQMCKLFKCDPLTYYDDL